MSYEKLVEKLRQKGWSEQDIQQAISILSSPSSSTRSWKSLYWLALIMSLLANFFISIIVVPFILLIPTNWKYLIVFVIALSFGALFNSLLNEIESQGGAYILSSLFMPALVLANAYFMIRILGLLSRYTTLFRFTSFTASSIVTIYSLVFLIPFIIQKIKENVRII